MAQTGVNFSVLIYAPNFDMWAVPITVNPVASQPGGASYAARGIYDTRQQLIALDDESLINVQSTILDIRTAEFPVPPLQGDIITIPFNSSGEPLGDFSVIDNDNNGGGEITLTLRKVV